MKAVVIPIVPAIQLKRILLATDLSEASNTALPIVSALARRYHSHVLIAHVRSPLSYPMFTPEVVVALEGKEMRKIKEDMTHIAQSPELAGVPADTVIESGAPAERIRRIAEREAIDLAVVSTHGRTGLKRFLMGSVAEDLFRHLKCPVLTIGPHIANRFAGQPELKSILYPTDLSEESRAAFPYVASLAHEYQAALKILHVLPVETSQNPDTPKLAEPLRKQMQRMFCPEMSPGCNAQFVIEAGNVVEKILSHAQCDRADLIAFGVRKAPEISTHFPGTAAYRIAVEAECPVLTARY